MTGVHAATTGANVTRHVSAAGELLAHRDASNNWEWLLADGLGSVRGVVSSAGSVLEHRHFDPFGSLYAGTMNETGYGFTGEPFDTASGLLYLRARHYRPANGTFVSRDPFAGTMARPLSRNGYAWVEGRVADGRDASGTCVQPTEWWNPIDVNCYYSAVGLAQRFSQGNPQAYNTWFNVLIQRDWTELKAIEALGSSADVTGSLNQFMTNSSILPTLFLQNPQIALQAVQQLGCENNISFGFLGGIARIGTAGTLSGGTATGGITVGGAPVVLVALGGLAAGILISLLFAGTMAEDQNNNEITYYFRGSTEGFAGGATAQSLGLTSTSTQPSIATVFATVAETVYGGHGVVYIATSLELAGINIGASNWLSELEQEVVFEIAPSGFTDLAGGRVSANRAREILSAMGRNLPSSITLQMQNLALIGLIPMTKEEIRAFVLVVHQEGS